MNWLYCVYVTVAWHFHALKEELSLAIFLFMGKRKKGERIAFSYSSFGPVSFSVDGKREERNHCVEPNYSLLRPITSFHSLSLFSWNTTKEVDKVRNTTTRQQNTTLAAFILVLLSCSKVGSLERIWEHRSQISSIIAFSIWAMVETTPELPCSSVSQANLHRNLSPPGETWATVLMGKSVLPWIFM